MTARNIVIVLGRCNRHGRGFGMRLERPGADQWVATWAFPIKDAAAKREGYERAEVSGSFCVGPSFPGCPHCSAASFFRCNGCGKLACWDGESRQITCPWCGHSGALGGEITSLDITGDR
jgi:hypothetical protein